MAALKKRNTGKSTSTRDQGQTLDPILGVANITMIKTTKEADLLVMIEGKTMTSREETGEEESTKPDGRMKSRKAGDLCG